MQKIWVRASLAIAVALFVVGGYMLASSMVAERIRREVITSVSCVINDPTVDIQTARILPGLITGNFGKVELAGELKGAVNGTVDATFTGVKRKDGLVTFSSGTAVFDLTPPAGVHAQADGSLSFGISGVAEAFVEPTLDGTSIKLELRGISVGGEKLGDDQSDPMLQGQKIDPIDLSPFLPEGTTPTGMKISKDTISVTADLKPTGDSRAVQFCIRK